MIRMCLAAVIALSIASLARGELGPDELAIVAVRSSPQSQEVARYYARARGVPESHICLIDVPPHRNLGQQQWATQVRPAIRRWLDTNHLRDQVRCLVTTWDVPLKIESRAKDSRRIAFLKAERASRVKQVRQLVDDFNSVAADPQAGASKPEQPNFGPDAAVADLGRAVQQAMRAAEQRLTDSQADPQIKREVAKVGGLVGQAGGIHAATQLLARRAKATPGDPKAIQQHALALGRLAGLREVRGSISLLPESIERDVQILEVVSKSDGLLATIAWIDEQLKFAGGNETYSSFDSELSLLWWPRYALVRWVPNPLHWRYDDNPSRELRRTLMVSRLEAPSVELTKKLVDAAIETEKKGLAGKVYLDARGLGGDDPEAKAGSYERYDQSLRRLQKLLAEHSDLKVVLDNKPELFQKGDCPQVALYCGWYSLAKYVDAFEWLPGSVGYHMASSEAVTLRGAKSQVWCKRMLDEGVAATLGPVYEPYLSAFPLPEEFFPVLTSGRYTLVETYYRTKPFNSWVMVLVGDPLYNPFRENRQFRGDLPENLKKLLGPSTEL